MMRRRDLAESIVESFNRYVRVQRGQRIAQPLRQHCLAEAGTLRVKFAGRDVRAMLGGKAKLPEPLQRGFLDGGFGEVHPAH